MLPGEILFGFIGLVVVITAVGMVISRNAVYSALFLVSNFTTVALLYLILGAPFIAVVQISVYAGSIMVLFLFVIMLLGAERLAANEKLQGQRLLAIILGVVFLVELGLFGVWKAGYMTTPVPPAAANAGAPEAVGMALFTQYALPFEVTGFILLVATVGAILLTRGDKPASKDLITAVSEKEG